MPRLGGRPWVFTALAAVLLVVLQCFGPGSGGGTAGGLAVEAREFVVSSACDGPAGAGAAGEHMRVRARPHACPVTDGHVAVAVQVRTDAPAARPSLPRMVAYDESRPAGRELPSLLQVFRC